MRRYLASFVATVLIAGFVAGPAAAQKQGGILRMPLITSPASMSIHEESTIAALGPMMGVFNNLIMFDQHVKQNSLASIVPDLRTNRGHGGLSKRGPGETLPVPTDKYPLIGCTCPSGVSQGQPLHFSCLSHPARGVSHPPGANCITPREGRCSGRGRAAG